VTIAPPRATSSIYDELAIRRLGIVNEHVRAENAHDVHAVVATFAADPVFSLNGESFRGRDAAAAAHAGLFEGFPDLVIEPAATHVSGDVIIVESVQRGTHDGPFQGIAPTGRRIEVPVCTLFVFRHTELVAETVYLDVALVLGQLGALSG
jgi:steroid delta-isomerase-like uncharacterized protein